MWTMALIRRHKRNQITGEGNMMMETEIGRTHLKIEEKAMNQEI